MREKPWVDRDWAAVDSTIFRPIYRESDGFAQVQQERVVPLTAKVRIRTKKVYRRFCKHGHDKFEPHGSYVRMDGHGRSFFQCAVCQRASYLKWWYSSKNPRQHGVRG